MSLVHLFDNLEEDILEEIVQDVMECRYIPSPVYIYKKWANTLRVASLEECQALFHQFRELCKAYMYSSSSSESISKQLQTTLEETTYNSIISLLSHKRAEWIQESKQNRVSSNRLIDFQFIPQTASSQTGMGHTHIPRVQLSMQVIHTPTKAGDLGNVSNLQLDLDELSLELILENFRRLRKQLSSI